jgi:hypothetical protein
MLYYHPEPLQGPTATRPHLLRCEHQYLCNLCGRQIPHVREDKNGAVGFAQLRQARLHTLEQFVVLQPLLRRRIRSAVCAVQDGLSVLRQAPQMSRLITQHVRTPIPRNAIEPCPEGGAGFEKWHRFVRGQKHLLRNILPMDAGPLQHLDTKPDHLGVILPYEAIERCEEFLFAGLLLVTLQQILPLGNQG